MVMLVILIVGITAGFISSLNSVALQNTRNQKTADSLVRAKEALIGYAVTYGDTHNAQFGYLPCPDLNGGNGEGSSPGSCGSIGVHQIGRLPWRTLDLPPLFDGAGECLWYAVSGKYKNNPASTTPMNWDNPGEFTVKTGDDNIIEPGEVVAAVIAPGLAIDGNSSRTGSSAPTCGGNYTAAAYLENDTVHSVNNADISQAKLILPHEHRDANANVTSSTNDQILYITRQDIWNTIQKRITRQSQKCLDDYAAHASNPMHKYPWAVVLTDTTTSPNRTGTLNVRFGRFPDSPNINTTTAGSGTCATGPLSGLTAAQLANLNSYIQQAQTALNAYTVPGTTGSTLNSAGDMLKDVAGNSPYNLSSSNPIRAAGIYIDANCTGDPKSCTNTSTMQTMLDAAFAEIASCANSNGNPDSMPNNWSSIPSCNVLVSSASWPAWRDLIFMQIAEGYQPGGSGSCIPGTTCLGISGSAHTNSGSGSYHAVVVTSSKAILGQNHSVADSVANFLEGANATGKTNIPSTTSFEAYHPSDPTYKTVNDMVLCLDGKINCK